MTAKDIFGLILRLGALWLIFWGCYYLLAALIYLPAAIQGLVSQTPDAYHSIRYAAYGGPAAVIGLLVLRFAEGIIRFTYRDRSGMKRLLLALLLSTLTCSAEGPTGAMIRAAKDIVLHFKGDANPTRVHLAAAPYISQGVITLYPGDKIIVEFDLVDSQPKNPRVVKEITHPERTLELEMIQDKDISGVKRKSGFAKKLSMDSYFLLLGSDFKNHANMYPLDKSLPCFDGFDPKTYCIKFYSFQLID